MLTTGGTIRLPMPHDGQKRARLRARRFNYLTAGRRWRKTSMCMSICVEAALTGGTYIWGAPTYDQVRIGWNETRRADPGGLIRFLESRMTAILPGGGTIIYRSLDDPDNVRGYTANGVVIDEKGDVNALAWREVLRPMLIDTGGWSWLIGSSKGKDWSYSEEQANKANPDCLVIRAPTLGVRIDKGGLIHREKHLLENPFIDFAEIKSLWESYQRTGQEYIFYQEILSDPEAASGSRIYDAFRDDEYGLDTNVTELAEYAPSVGSVLYAVDDGYAGMFDTATQEFTAESHPRVFLLVQEKPDGHLDVFYESYAVRKMEEEQIGEVLRLPYDFPDYAAIDKSAAQLKGRLHDAGIQTINGPVSVAESIKNLRRLISPDENGFRQIRIHPRCKHLRYELANYRYKEGTQEPIKASDHGCDALRYLAWKFRNA